MSSTVVARRPAVQAPASLRPATVRRASALLLRAALSAGGLAVLVLWWHDPANLRDPAAVVTAMGRVAGLLAAYLVLVQVLLMARLPWFERAVGFDRLAGWHRGLGTNVVLLMVAHVLLVVEGYALADHRGAAAETWSVLTTFPSMLKATAGLVLFGAVAVSSARAARRRLSYEAWYAVHLGAYVAVALTFFHQTGTGADFIRNPTNRLLWTAMYVGVAGAVLLWRVVFPVRAWARHRMIVDQVVPEGEDAVSVWVRGRDLGALGARAGQFLLWRFIAPGHLGSAHPYSLSARPDGNRLRITVKVAGDHSAALATLRPGTPVLAEGPFGHFTADARVGRRTLLIGGGSGMAPVRALAEELAGEPGVRPGDVVVLQRAGTRADLLLGGELSVLADRGRIVLHSVVGHRAALAHDPLEPRRLARLVPDVHERDIYVCGPAGMTASVLAGLRHLGVPADRLHVEGFSL